MYTKCVVIVFVNSLSTDNAIIHMVSYNFSEQLSKLYNYISYTELLIQILTRDKMWVL